MPNKNDEIVVKASPKNLIIFNKTICKMFLMMKYFMLVYYSISYVKKLYICGEFHFIVSIALAICLFIYIGSLI